MLEAPSIIFTNRQCPVASSNPGRFIAGIRMGYNVGALYEEQKSTPKVGINENKWLIRRHNFSC